MVTYLLHLRDVLHAMFDHDLEIHINFDPLGLVHLFPFRLLLPQVVHLFPSVLPILLQTLYLLQTIGLFRGLRRVHRSIISAVFQCAVIHALCIRI